MKKLDKILNELYTELYKHATPSIDFEELKKTSPKDKEGRILIPYDDYEIEREMADSIFNTIVKKYKLKAMDKKALSFSFFLGCSPRFKEIDNGNK